MTPIQNQLIALAGIAQAAQQVHRIATTGQYDPAATAPLVDGLFVFDPENTAAVFGGIGNIRPGLQLLGDLFNQQQSPVFEPIMRYMLGIIQIANQLKREPEMLGIIRSRLEHAERHRQHFPDQPNAVVHNIAAIYQDTISTLRFRIKVTGTDTHLKNSNNAEMIRTLLLAGIRAAWLWQQVGGKRWHWFFKRNTIMDNLLELLR
ncbi:MAG: lysogenization regulator HflD [Gammaproteobacteria bacterium]|nr:MAG: lysogenization regulator HflD [Gammaproteobacteria bacterium]